MSKNYIEDFKKAGVQLLDETDLELVKGGSATSGGCMISYCLFDYECYAVFKLQVSPGEYDDCVLNYLCHLAFNTPGS